MFDKLSKHCFTTDVTYPFFWLKNLDIIGDAARRLLNDITPMIKFNLVKKFYMKSTMLMKQYLPFDNKLVC